MQGPLPTKILHTGALHTENFYTQVPCKNKPLTRRNFQTQLVLCHTENFYARKFDTRNRFWHKSFYTQKTLLHKQLLHIETLMRKKCFMQTLVLAQTVLHTETCTQNCNYHLRFWRSARVSCETVAFPKRWSALRWRLWIENLEGLVCLGVSKKIYIYTTKTYSSRCLIRLHLHLHLI